MYPVVVLCGGLGTRVKSVTNDAIPKVLIEVNGHPFLDYKIHGLISQGFNEIVLLTSFLGEQVENRVANQNNYGVDVRCFADGETQLGTAGAIRRVLAELSDTFWITWGDTYLQFDAAEAEKRFREIGCKSLMTILRNQDQFETSNVSISDSVVTAYEKPATPGTHDFIDYGMLLFKRECFEPLAPETPADLRQVNLALIEHKEMALFEVQERFHDIGNLAAIAETEKYFAENNTWNTISTDLPR